MTATTNWRDVLEQAGFGAPSFAEVALCAAVARGDEARLGDGALGGVAVPAGMLGTVRGGVLRALMLGAVPGVVLSAQGLWARGLRVSGVVDLAAQGSRERPLPPLVLRDCSGETAAAGFTLVLRDACPRGLNLAGCTLAGLDGDRMQVQGETDLRRVTLLPGGTVSLIRADLAGALILWGAVLGWGRDDAGEWLQDPEVDGAVLTCNGARIGATVFLQQVRAAGLLDFGNSSIGGNLDAEDALLHAPGGEALLADGASIAGDVSLRRLKALGEVRFLGTSIGGDLVLLGADLRQPEGDALSCDRMRLRGDLFLKPDLQRSRVLGQIRLLGAEIGGNCSLLGADLTGPLGQPAVDAEDARIGGSLLAYPAEGQACTMRGGLHATGARVAGGMNLYQAVLTPHDQAPDAPVLDLRHASIGSRLTVPGMGAESRGVVDLSHASVTLLDDQDGLAWGPASHNEPRRDAEGHLTGLKLVLDGFTYQRIPDPERGDWAGREAFLKRQFEGTRPAPRDFKPQPWEQLIKTLRIQGHAEQAERFARMKRDFAIECRAEHWLRRGWGRFVGVFFGHYYHPLRALGSAAGYALLGVLLLAIANYCGQLTRKRNDVDLTAASLGVLAPFPTYPAPAGAPAQSRPPAMLGAAEACWDGVSFGTVAEALGSALDMMLPVVDLHQDQRCEVTEKAGAHGLVAWLLLLYGVFGWVVSSLAIVTLSGVAKKD